MDFRPGDRQDAAQKAAAAVFGSRPPRSGGLDTDAWRLLSETGLTGLGLPEDVGGAGCGVLEVCSVLVEQGRHLVAVPAVESILAAGPAIERFGTGEQRRRLLPRIAAGEIVAVPALFGPPVAATADGVLRGVTTCVPYGSSADVLLVPARGDDGRLGVFLTPREGVDIEEQTTTSGQPQAQITVDGVRSEWLGASDCHRFLVERSTVGMCAQQVGVLDEALRLTATYTSQREQFGRPIATFQAVAMRAADAYGDVETCRVTMWRAAWLLSVGRPASSAVAVAKFWAAEAGYRVSAATTHLHGGMGVATDYPLHRYTLWARQNELSFGAAGAQLGILGSHLAGGGIDS